MLNASNLLRACRSATKGVGLAFREEQNFRIQVIIALVTIAGGMLLQFSSYEWIALLLAIGMVLAAELFNSVFERLLDSMKPRVSVLVGAMKDLMSAAVLVSATTAFCIGLLLFLPRFIHIFASLFE